MTSRKMNQRVEGKNLPVKYVIRQLQMNFVYISSKLYNTVNQITLKIKPYRRESKIQYRN